ncbi:helix-turn-helix transcriptional regulator [Streptomyces sp. 111WW2]|uniref:helix-turn-helix transcriptional regulator n=1 Tax=Streptomyces sp. 111WW2 TaxID=1945515 RepID=UPI00130080E2|nr:helix-turn-helix transcriptional regulator [Streptomyces sp. 111WW2]
MTTAPERPAPATRAGRPLTKLELHVLEQIANGLSCREIAAANSYTHHAALKTTTRILRKLNAQNRAHAVFLAVAAGVLDPTRRHGGHPGFVAHRRRGEEPCEACWDGERAYRRGRRAARKATQTTPVIRTS